MPGQYVANSGRKGVNGTKKRGKRVKKAIYSKTREGSSSDGQVKQLLDQAETLKDAKSLIMAPCFNCPVETQCGRDPTRFSFKPEECKILEDWVLWSANVWPVIDFLLSVRKAETSSAAMK